MSRRRNECRTDYKVSNVIMIFQPCAGRWSVGVSLCTVEFVNLLKVKFSLMTNLPCTVVYAVARKKDAPEMTGAARVAPGNSDKALFVYIQGLFA